MNWLEKVRDLKEEKERVGYSGPYLIDICPSIPKWQQGELEALQKKYPWLPEAYIAYLKEFDSTSIAWCNFFGSNKCDGVVLENQITELRLFLNDNYFPFGKDIVGNIYILSQHNQVLKWRKDDYDFKKPILLANTFEEFVADCLLGKRYEEFESIENNTFYKFLQIQGWV